MTPEDKLSIACHTPLSIHDVNAIAPVMRCVGQTAYNIISAYDKLGEDKFKLWIEEIITSGKII